MSHQRGAPSCHHARSAGAHLGRVPAPCGHDHQPIVVDAATTVRTASRAVDAPVVAINSSASLSAARVAIARGPSPPVGLVSPSLPLALSIVRRI
jgi:hypothetical protein